jgi:putative acetyltransferase
LVIIREEHPTDRQAVRNVNLRAFGQTLGADLVDTLWENCPDLLSLVALEGNRVVGHILFSPATITDEERMIEGVGLAPMAVLPDVQRQGIGSELVRAGIEKLASSRCPFVIVLEHPEYYPRFGFGRASGYGIKSEWEVPDDAFMILIPSHQRWVLLCRSILRFLRQKRSEISTVSWPVGSRSLWKWGDMLTSAC